MKRTIIKDSVAKSTVAEDSYNDFIIIWFTDKKIFAVATPKPPHNEWSTVYIWSNKEERRRGKDCLHMNNVQSLLMVSLSDFATLVWNLLFQESRSMWHHNLLLLQQWLSAISWASSWCLSRTSFFFIALDVYIVAQNNRAVNLLAENLVKCCLIYYFFYTHSDVPYSV